MSASVAVFLARKIAASNFANPDTRYALWAMGSIRIVLAGKVLFGEQRTTEQLIVDFGAMDVTSAIEDDPTETFAIAMEKAFDRIAESSVTTLAGTLAASCEMASDVAFRGVTVIYYVDGDSTAEELVLSSENTFEETAETEVGIAPPIAAVTCLSVEYGTCPFEAATRSDTSSGETELLTKELPKNLLYPAMLDCPENTDDEDESRPRSGIAKEQLDELFKPSYFDWADDIDDEDDPVPQFITQQANELLPPQRSIRADSTDGENEWDKLKLSPEPLTLDEGDFSPGWVREPESEYPAADNLDSDDEMKIVMGYMDMSRGDGENAPFVPFADPIAPTAEYWEVQPNPLSRLNYRWELTIRRCREMKEQGLGPRKAVQATRSSAEFFSGLGPFHPEQSSAFDYRSLAMPELLSYGPSHSDRVGVNCDFAHPHLKDMVPNWEAMRTLNSGCIGSGSFPRFDVLAYRPGPSKYWPKGGRKPIGVPSGLRFVENSSDKDDLFHDESELAEEDILTSKGAEEVTWGEDTSREQKASCEQEAVPYVGENLYNEGDFPDEEDIKTPEPLIDSLTPDCLNLYAVAEDPISSGILLLAIMLPVDDLAVYLTYLPWIEEVADGEEDPHGRKKILVNSSTLDDHGPQAEYGELPLVQGPPPRTTLPADNWIEILWYSVDRVVRTLADLTQ
ncbi:MAG: hypothetical protein M1840_004951 [Geoglossum simile]|nr:MAG: hypothetical protein M1840_004951 [Geoglossum simile]